MLDWGTSYALFTIHYLDFCRELAAAKLGADLFSGFELSGLLDQASIGIEDQCVPAVEDCLRR